MRVPGFIEPQLSQLVEAPPEGPGWIHELKYDGYRMAMRISGDKAQLLTRSGLDWTVKYPVIAAAGRKLKTKGAYIDGELCAIRADGTTSFASMQAVSDEGEGAALVYFAFDLLYLDGQDIRRQPLLQRKAALAKLLRRAPTAIRYSDHVEGHGEEFLKQVCATASEGMMSKEADGPYKPGNRGAWVPRAAQEINLSVHCLRALVGFMLAEGIGNSAAVSVFEIYRRMRETSEWLANAETEIQARRKAMVLSEGSRAVVIQNLPTGSTKVVATFENGRDIKMRPLED